MELLIPKYRRNPNEKVESAYWGVANGMRTVSAVVKPSHDRNRLEATGEYGKGLPRGEGGRIGILVLGGMETTLDEVEYILESKRHKQFKAQRKSYEVAQMCRVLAEQRSERIEAARKMLQANPSLAKAMPRKQLYLPTGYRYVATQEPGMKVLMKVNR